MQSRKASKKTSKKTDETVVNEISSPEAAAKKQPASRSSKPKKQVAAEKPVARNHRKVAVGVANVPASEISLAAKELPEPVDKPKVMAAVAGASESAGIVPESVVIDPVDAVAAPENGTRSHYSHQEVADLAYSYWVARGYAHGSHEEDWRRAEAELAGQS